MSEERLKFAKWQYKNTLSIIERDCKRIIEPVQGGRLDTAYNASIHMARQIDVARDLASEIGALELVRGTDGL